jgi:hypothetical protein
MSPPLAGAEHDEADLRRMVRVDAATRRIFEEACFAMFLY